MGITVGFCGCGEITGLPSAEPVAVLQGLLVVGEPRHLLQADWSSPAHLPYEPTPQPIDSSLVDLWLAAPTGDSTRYAPTGLPGQFAASATVQPGKTYRLSGTVAGRAVTAQVNIPGTLVVNQPAGDTLRQELNELPFVDVPFIWRADSASAYQAFLVDADGIMHMVFVRLEMDSTGRIFSTTPDTSGHLLIPSPSEGIADTARLVIYGYDPSAAGFYSSTTKGNVRGAFGLFGAAAKAEKVIVWE